MMNILIVSESFPSNSNPCFGKKRFELAEKLAKEGCNVQIITVDDVDRITSESYESIPVVRVPKIYNPPSIYYPVPRLYSLLKVVNRMSSSFDIIHFFKQEYLTVIPAFFECNRLKVITIDNFPGLDYKHGVFVIDFISFLYSVSVVRRLLRKFDGFISLNKASVRTAIKLGVDKDKIRWIPHGIDINKIRPDLRIRAKIRNELGIDGTCFLFAGRLSPVKGLTYLVKAVHLLDKEGLKGNFIVIGRGSEYRRVLSLRKSKNIQVFYLGYKDNAIDYIQASDFLVLPSTGEGCPNVVVEAFACGKPVVGSKVGGIPDLVEHKKNGILVEPRSVTGLAEAIKELVSDPEEAKKMGENARNFAKKKLDWKIIIRQLISFYMKVMHLRDN